MTNVVSDRYQQEKKKKRDSEAHLIAFSPVLYSESVLFLRKCLHNTASNKSTSPAALIESYFSTVIKEYRCAKSLD